MMKPLDERVLQIFIGSQNIITKIIGRSQREKDVTLQGRDQAIVP